jgi:hypothetical protein
MDVGNPHGFGTLIIFDSFPVWSLLTSGGGLCVCVWKGEPVRYGKYETLFILPTKSQQ